MNSRPDRSTSAVRTPGSIVTPEATSCSSEPGGGAGMAPMLGLLRSMAERIQTAGGRLEISSRPYQGTQVVLRLPG